MATAKIVLDEGTTTNTATYTGTEDAVTKHVGRTVLNNSSLTEIGTSSNPIQVTLANTGANTNKLLVTPDLPSGAATATKQPALGTAGSASSDVITVQGIASMTKLLVTPDLPSGASTAANQSTGNSSLSSIDGKLVTAKTADYDTGAGTDTVQMTGIALPASGGAVAGGTSSNPIQVSLANTAANSTAVKVDGSGVTQPVSGTFWQTTQPVSGTVSVNALPAGTNTIGNVDIQDASGNGLTSNSTTFTSKHALDTNLLGTLGTAFSTAGKVDVKAADGDVFVRQATASNLNATVVGTGTFTVQAQESGTWNVGLNAGSNLVGKVGIDQTTPGTTNAVTPVPASNSGWSFSYQSALSNTATQIKSTAGTFGGWAMLFNPNTATTYIQVFNKASASVTLGSTAPDFVIPLPGVASASATGLAANWESVHGIAMSTGITVAATTTATGSTAPSNAIVATFLYK